MQGASQLLGAAQAGQAPVARGGGNGVDAAELGEHGGCALRTPAGEAGKAVGRVAHQRQVVGDGAGRHTELHLHCGGVDDLVLAPVVLHHSGALHALTKVFVGGDDEHLLDPRVGVGHRRRCGQGIVGLPLHHRPGGETAGHEHFLHHGDLVQQHFVHALAALVTGVQIVAEALDHVVAGHADMRCAGGHQLQRAGHHAHRRVVRPGVAVARDLAEVLTEQLVGAVDEVNSHRMHRTARATSQELGKTIR